MKEIRWAHNNGGPLLVETVSIELNWKVKLYWIAGGYSQKKERQPDWKGCHRQKHTY